MTVLDGFFIKWTKNYWKSLISMSIYVPGGSHKVLRFLGKKVYLGPTLPLLMVMMKMMKQQIQNGPQLGMKS